MFRFPKPPRCGWLLALIAVSLSPALYAQERVLTLAEAVAAALARDPLTARYLELAAGYEAEAVADGQLPDPSLQVGLLNFPTDTFARDQEPMTQVQVGVRQAFPPGDSLAIKSSRTGALSEAEVERSRARAREVVQAVRENWIELHYWLQAEQVVSANRSLFEQLSDITSRQYAAGRHNQQDVIRAELELNTLDDRITEIRTRQETSRAELVKWVGTAAEGTLHDGLPGLPQVPERPQLESQLKDHPLLEVEQALVQVQQRDVELAREAYKPGFSVGVSYGARSGSGADGSDRPDFASATLSVELPLFTEKRQDQRLAASQRRQAAATLGRDEKYLQLRRMLAVNLSEQQRLQERLRLYRNKLLPQAAHSTEASLSAYQNDRTDFTALMRARMTELEVRLRALRLEADLAKVNAKLLYLAGEPQ